MKPDFEGPRAPFEIGLIGLCVLIGALLIVLIGLYLTDAGVVNW
jgi:hypothetical protein